MKPKIKRLLIAIGSLLLGTNAFAHDFEVDGIFYNIKSSSPKSVEVTYSGSSYNSISEYWGSIVIPSTVTFYGTTYSVTSIGKEAFRDCRGLTSVSIPNSVTSIGNYAFSGCFALTSISIPNSVTYIGNSVFYGCSGLTELIIADGTENLSLGYNGSSQGLFFDCPLEKLYLGRNLSYNTGYDYGHSPFYNKTTLKEVTIGNTVTSIGAYAFEDCSGLTSVTIGNSVTEIGVSAFQSCGGLTSVSVGNSVTSIGTRAFYNCGLTGDLVIPNSVTSIGYEAFKNCSGLTSVTIGNSVTTIGEGAFDSCTGLTSLTIGNSVTSIGVSAFGNCSGLTSVIIPDSVTFIGDEAFTNCNGLTEVNITDLSAWCKIGYGGLNANPLCKAHHLKLNGSEITDLVIPDGITSIRYCAFYGWTGLTSVTIPNSVTSIGLHAFTGCTGLKSVIIGNSVTSIDNYAFNRCYKLKKVINLSKLSLTKGSTSHGYVACYADEVINAKIDGDFIWQVSENKLIAYLGNTKDLILPTDYNGENYEIGDDAFKNCDDLTSVSIPNSVTSIGSSAFYECIGLTEVNITDLSAWCKIGFESSTSNPLYYAHHLKLNGMEITNLIIPDEITEIKDYAFGGCNGLTSVSIPNSVTSIGDEAFYNCDELRTVTIGNSVTKIGDWAFSYCSGLTEVTIPNSVTSIGESAFIGCSGLKSVTIGNSVTSIGNWAFEDCIGLTEVNIIDLSAWCNINFADSSSNPLTYADCLKLNGSKITNLVIPDDITEIKRHAFAWYSGLTSVTIGNSVTSIGNYAFYYCSGLKSVTIPNSVTEIREGAFAYCSGLTKLYSKAIVPPTCGKNAFYNIDKSNCELYVPKASIADYQAADQWKEFFFIKDIESGVEEVLVDGEDYSNAPIEIYNLSGLKVGDSTENLAPGVYIKRQGRKVEKIAIQ